MYACFTGKEHSGERKRENTEDRKKWEVSVKDRWLKMINYARRFWMGLIIVMIIIIITGSSRGSSSTVSRFGKGFQCRKDELSGFIGKT